MIIGVDIYEKIRTMYSVNKMSQRVIARELGISRNTVKKYCEGEFVPWERKDYSRKPVVITEDILNFIKACLEEDKKEGIKKQQHTAKRIYDRLVDEMDFQGGESTVRLAVQKIKDQIEKAYIPLSFDPGEAVQVDWGEATVYIDNRKQKVNLFCMRLCYSCDIYVTAFYRQNEESFLEGIIKAFEHFKGVPIKLIFDNARVAVKEGFGVYAKEQDRFLALKAHYAFRTEFCNPASGNEKGLIENLVGWIRRNVLVPVPRVKDIDELNKILFENCIKYRKHQIKDRSMTVGQMYEIDKSSLLSLPKYRFDSSRSISATIDEFSTVRFDRNYYSVPVKYVGRDVSIKGYGLTVNIYYRGEEIAVHRRNYGRGQAEYKLEHYIDLIERRPRSVFNAKPVKANVDTELLEWGRNLPGGARDVVKLLRLCVDYGVEEIIKIKRSIPENTVPSIDLIRGYLIPKEQKTTNANDDITVQKVDLKAYDKQFLEVWVS